MTWLIAVVEHSMTIPGSNRMSGYTY